MGCWTGNTLSIIFYDKISKYIGIDIPPDMVGYAKLHFYDIKFNFIVGNFITNEYVCNYKFDTVICVFCLHWFIPNEGQAVEKIREILKPEGKLFLSCAFSFDYFPGEKYMQNNVL